MWVVVLVCYSAIGLIAAGFTLAAFPTYNGYRPPLLIFCAAVATYVLLWPVLALMGLGYLIGMMARPKKAPRVRQTPRVGHRFLYRALYEETPN